jgi:hypothetical protein
MKWEEKMMRMRMKTRRMMSPRPAKRRLKSQAQRVRASRRARTKKSLLKLTRSQSANNSDVKLLYV